jgi:hypothetical protein
LEQATGAYELILFQFWSNFDPNPTHLTKIKPCAERGGLDDISILLVSMQVRAEHGGLDDISILLPPSQIVRRLTFLAPNLTTHLI